MTAAPDIPPHRVSEEPKLSKAKRLYIEGVEAFEMEDPQTALVTWEETYAP